MATHQQESDQPLRESASFEGGKMSLATRTSTTPRPRPRDQLGLMPGPCYGLMPDPCFILSRIPVLGS